MIVAGGLTLTSSHVMALKKGQAIFRDDTGKAPVISHSSQDYDYDYFGNAAHGLRAIAIRTANFPDHAFRPVIAYVPASAGLVRSK